MQTYFISDGTRVKIGKSENPQQRLNQLQTGSSQLLELLITIDGDFEAQYHNVFQNDRFNGEWFKWSPNSTELVFFITTGRRRTSADSLLNLHPVD